MSVIMGVKTLDTGKLAGREIVLLWGRVREKDVCPDFNFDFAHGVYCII
jgi:hypothetical protein